MATIEHPAQARPVPRERLRDYPAGGLRFDLVVALLSIWFMIGLYIDGWAHNHGEVDNTFFTPWHALLYTGILAVGVFLAVNQYRNVSKGYAWSRALPKGYLLSLFGVVGFFLGGGFDLVWHELFGFEANMEALLSPAHLLLAGAGLLILTGPIRAAWNRPQSERGWKAMLPTILALLVLLSLLTFFTQYANFFSQGRILTYMPRSDAYFWDVTGIASVLFQTVITMFVLLLAARRWQLPFGAVTFLLTVNAALMVWLQWSRTQEFLPVLIAAPAAGLVADVLLRRYQPITAHPFALRVFGFAVPFVMFGIGMTILMAGYGIFWREHMWLGTTITAAMTGVGMTYLLVPPAVPDEAK